MRQQKEESTKKQKGIVYRIKIKDNGDLIHKKNLVEERYKRVVIEIDDESNYLKSISYLVNYGTPFFDEWEFRSLHRYYLQFLPNDKYLALEEELKKVIPTFFTKDEKV